MHIQTFVGCGGEGNQVSPDLVQLALRALLQFASSLLAPSSQMAFQNFPDELVVPLSRGRAQLRRLVLGRYRKVLRQWEWF